MTDGQSVTPRSSDISHAAYRQLLVASRVASRFWVSSFTNPEPHASLGTTNLLPKDGVSSSNSIFEEGAFA